MTTPSPSHSLQDAVLILDNGQLTVEIAAPGRYLSPRFCRGAFIFQVTLHAPDGDHTFCANELEDDGPEGPFSGGAGLCGEFGIFRPIGYDNALPGEWFPKLGTGLLRRADNRGFNFGFDFEMQPYPIEVRATEDGLTFVTEPVEVRGYAAHLEQTLCLDGNQLIVESHLRNCGVNPLATHEYRHNFLAHNGDGPGPGTRLRLSFEADVAVDRLLDATHHDGTTEVNFRKRPRKGFFHPAAVLGQCAANSWWELEWTQRGAGVREMISTPLSRFHLYGTPGLLSPEAFVDLMLLPGESTEWTRTYTFFAGRNAPVASAA